MTWERFNRRTKTSHFVREASLREHIITRLRDEGVPRREVAGMFGISVDTVTDIAARVHCCSLYYPRLWAEKEEPPAAVAGGNEDRSMESHG